MRDWLIRNNSQDCRNDKYMEHWLSLRLTQTVLQFSWTGRHCAGGSDHGSLNVREVAENPLALVCLGKLFTGRYSAGGSPFWNQLKWVGAGEAAGCPWPLCSARTSHWRRLQCKSRSHPAESTLHPRRKTLSSCSVPPMLSTDKG